MTGTSDIFLDLAACLEKAGADDAAAEALAVAEAPPRGPSGRALHDLEEWIPPGHPQAWECLTVARSKIGRRPVVLAGRRRQGKR